MDEPELIQQIRTGDELAFEKLFRLYYERLCRYANQLVKDGSLSEELVQEVFVTIWENREKLHVQTGIKPYLYRAVHNRCLNSMKHEQVRQNYSNSVLADPAVGAYRNGEQLEAKELNSRIASALEKLPPECRKAFRLSRFEEFSYHEIAAYLGISVKTVENQIGKALKMMRSELADYLVHSSLLILFSRYLLNMSEGNRGLIFLNSLIG
jgi:RNA polymerase sigma-70 factor (ECF subfamily)